MITGPSGPGTPTPASTTPNFFGSNQDPQGGEGGPDWSIFGSDFSWATDGEGLDLASLTDEQTTAAALSLIDQVTNFLSGDGESLADALAKALGAGEEQAEEVIGAVKQVLGNAIDTLDFIDTTTRDVMKLINNSVLDLLLMEPSQEMLNGAEAALGSLKVVHDAVFSGETSELYQKMLEMWTGALENIIQKLDEAGLDTSVLKQQYSQLVGA